MCNLNNERGKEFTKQGEIVLFNSHKTCIPCYTLQGKEGEDVLAEDENAFVPVISD
jgi:hypothetical protein